VLAGRAADSALSWTGFFLVNCDRVVCSRGVAANGWGSRWSFALRLDVAGAINVYRHHDAGGVAIVHGNEVGWLAQTACPTGYCNRAQ